TRRTRRRTSCSVCCRRTISPTRRARCATSNATRRSAATIRACPPGSKSCADARARAAAFLRGTFDFAPRPRSSGAFPPSPASGRNVMLQLHRLAWSAVLFSALVSGACLSGGNSINAYGGARSLDASELNGLDDLTTYGVDAVLKLDIPFLAV